MSKSQVYVVEASAGSGKTYALARRYLKLLINPELAMHEVPLKNILAITFTNKAAFEMKARILDFLKKIALDVFVDAKEKNGLLEYLGVDEAYARSRAILAMEAIIKNYNFFQVQTIDSFVNAILSGCAFRLGLSSIFRIKTDYRDYLSESLDRMVDRALQDKRTAGVFSDFMSHYLRLENKSGWFPHKDILENVKTLFYQANIYGVNFYRSPTKAAEVIALKKKVTLLMRKLAEELPSGSKATFEKSLSSFLEAGRDIFDIGDVPKAFEKEDFPITKKGDVGAKVMKLWQQIRILLRELSEREAGFLFNPYIDIFSAVAVDFRMLSRKDDVLFLEELNRRARDLFGEEGVTVPELYYRLAARMKAYLIDEFQDTSRLQWNNLYPMVLEAISTGGSLFYVGDKKQAIYRFRGGDVGLFDEVKDGFKPFSVQEDSLTSNYRSRSNIVEFCNACFSPDNLRIFLKEKDRDKKKGVVFDEKEESAILSIFEKCIQNTDASRQGGYVYVEPLEGNNKEERNDNIRPRLMTLVEDLHKRFEYEDIAILVRENDEVELITEWFIEEHLPVESEKTLNIRNNPYIKELVSFLSFLNSPIDDLSFASFILGDIFSCASGMGKDELRDFIFEISRKRRLEKTGYLYTEFRLRFPDVWESWIEEFFKNIGFVPLYELLISIYGTFSVFENFVSQQGFFMKFLEVVKDSEALQATSIALFLDFFRDAGDEKMYVHVADASAVKVLTIHKAKGLDFGVVVLPFFEMNVKTEPNVATLEDNCLCLRRVTEKYRSFSPQIDAVYRSQYLKCFIDELNVAYVGLTRAREELYVFVPQKSRRGANLLDRFIPEAIRETGSKLIRQKEEKPVGLVEKIPTSSYKDWISFLKEEFIDRSSLENRDKRLKGEVLHSALSGIPEVSEEDKEKALEAAFKAARSRFPVFDDWAAIERSVTTLVSDDKFRKFFFTTGATVYREKEVTDAGGNTRRIDRLVVLENEVWVIDYKSSGQETDKDIVQVKQYLTIVADLYPGKKRQGFIIYLDNMSVRDVHE